MGGAKGPGRGGEGARVLGERRRRPWQTPRPWRVVPDLEHSTGGQRGGTERERGRHAASPRCGGPRGGARRDTPTWPHLERGGSASGWHPISLGRREQGGEAKIVRRAGLESPLGPAAEVLCRVCPACVWFDRERQLNVFDWNGPCVLLPSRSFAGSYNLPRPSGK